MYGNIGFQFTLWKSDGVVGLLLLNLGKAGSIRFFSRTLSDELEAGIDSKSFLY